MGKSKYIKVILSVIIFIGILFGAAFCAKKMLYGIYHAEPIIDNKETITTEYGDVFNISIVERTPDSGVSISVSQNQNSFFHGHIDGFMFDYYSYDNDFKTNWNKTICSHNEGTTRIYQFHWGIIYTTDNGESFLGVLKHEYSDRYRDDNKFAAIYRQAHSKPFHDIRYDVYLDAERRETLSTEEMKQIKKGISIQGIITLIGKAPRYMGSKIETGDAGIVLRELAIFEYDLEDGRIAVVWYINKNVMGSARLYVYRSRIREPYYSSSGLTASQRNDAVCDPARLRMGTGNDRHKHGNLCGAGGGRELDQDVLRGYQL